MHHSLPIFLFGAILAFALLLKLVNLKSKKYYLEHIIFSLHWCSFFLIFVTIRKMFFTEAVVGKFFTSLLTYVACIYLCIAIKKAYDQTPQDISYRSAYERLRFLAGASHVHRGQLLREAGRMQEAMVEFQKAAEIDPKQAFRLRLAWGRDRTQNVPENAKLQFERLRAVVLVVTCRHRDNEIALRDDTN